MMGKNFMIIMMKNLSTESTHVSIIVIVIQLIAI